MVESKSKKSTAKKSKKPVKAEKPVEPVAPVEPIEPVVKAKDTVKLKKPKLKECRVCGDMVAPTERNYEGADIWICKKCYRKR